MAQQILNSGPGRLRAEASMDHHEEEYKALFKQRGASFPVPLPNGYDAAAGTPASHPQARRGETRLDRHRRETAGNDRPVNEKAPFAGLRRDKE